MIKYMVKVNCIYFKKKGTQCKKQKKIRTSFGHYISVDAVGAIWVLARNLYI